MRDLVLTVSVIAGFALLITAHVTIAFGLARRAPRWRALVALVIPPLAPYWALGARMWVRASLWLASVAIYGVGRWLGAT